MRIRFRRSIKILPGIRLNLNRRSSSITVGGHGLHKTISSKGTRTTVGIPGTGLSASQYEPHAHAHAMPAKAEPPSRGGAIKSLVTLWS